MDHDENENDDNDKDNDNDAMVTGADDYLNII